MCVVCSREYLLMTAFKFFRTPIFGHIASYLYGNFTYVISYIIYKIHQQFYKKTYTIHIWSHWGCYYEAKLLNVPCSSQTICVYLDVNLHRPTRKVQNANNRGWMKNASVNYIYGTCTVSCGVLHTLLKILSWGIPTPTTHKLKKIL